MTDFTKKELLAINPCLDWKLKILAWPTKTISAKTIKEEIEKNGNANYDLVQIMGRDGKIAQAMLDEGVDPDIKNKYNQTPLIVAAIQNSETSVSVLQAAKADEKVVDIKGRSFDTLTQKTEVIK